MTSRTTSSATSSEKLFCKGIGRHRTLPFDLRWSFGINPNVPVLNLTTESQTNVAYACSHVVIMFDYRSNTAIALQGHRNAVKTLSISKNGKWLMSADFDKDNTVVIWDIESKLPAYTLFEPCGRNDKMTAARISPNAKYIVTIGGNSEHRQKISLWFWTRGKDEPDLSFELPDSDVDSEEVKEIVFSEEQSNCFACMSDNRMDFLIWRESDDDGATAALIFEHYSPKIAAYRGKVQGYGTFAGSCYLRNIDRALTVTTDGYVLAWNDIYGQRVWSTGRSSASRTSNHRMNVRHRRNSSEGWCITGKAVRLFECGITAIVAHERMAVIGNSVGRIGFYDDQLTLLYWCQGDSGNPDSVLSISFNLRLSLHGSVGPDDNEFDKDVPVRAYLFGCAASDAPSVHEKRSSYAAPDATVNCTSIPFHPCNFLACTATGTLVLFDMWNLKYRFLFRNCGTVVTSIAAHPTSCHLLIGMKDGSMRLYDYEKRQLIVAKKCPSLLDFERSIRERQKNAGGRGQNDGTAAYVSRLESYDSLRAVTALTYSPLCDMVACGMENGAMWILHPVSLEPLEDIPYKHSEDGSVDRVIFDKCATYVAYTDSAMTIAVFKRNDAKDVPRNDSADVCSNMWRFIGKLRAHSLPIKDILFGPTVPSAATGASRLLSLSEDRELVEYDLENSGPYPYPGLIIRRVDKIESKAIPLCLAWYPHIDAETLLIMANSEYKYRLLNDTTKTICGTFLGPTFDTPVQRIEMLTRYRQDDKKRAYAIFTTEKEIGIQLLPIDGNPYKAIGTVAYSSKVGERWLIALFIDFHFCLGIHDCQVRDIAIGVGGECLFTVGKGDCCVLLWKINLRSIDVMERLGGDDLLPYYCLIDGGRDGWMASEMKDLFYYTQVLHQGEKTAPTGIASDKISTKQIPNLMRAIGYYLSNAEVENILSELSYRHYTTSGRFVEEITFKEWIKLYLNHRPAFGIRVCNVRDAFLTLAHD